MDVRAILAFWDERGDLENPSHVGLWTYLGYTCIYPADAHQARVNTKVMSEEDTQKLARLGECSLAFSQLVLGIVL